MATLLLMALLMTFMVVYPAECAIIQSLPISSSSVREVPIHDADSSASAANKLRRPATHDFSDEQDEVGTTHDSDFIHRMLQLHARHKPETENGDTLLHSVNSENRGAEDEDSEGTAASIRILMRVLSELSNIDAEMKPTSAGSPQKRTCRFNLGGHCATEEAVNMANQWHFFNSHFSPGRRRRSVPQSDSVGRPLVEVSGEKHRSMVE